MVTKVDVNGIQFSTSGTSAYWLGKIDGLASPTYRTTSAVFAGRHGGMVPKQLYGQRLVTLEGGIDENNCTDHLAARIALMQALPIDTFVPVKVYLIDGRVMLFYAKFDQPTLPITAKGFSDFQLTAIANDYRLFDISGGSVNQVIVNKRVDGGLRWLTGADGAGARWRTGASGSGWRWLQGAGIVNAINAGTTSASPIITIYGANQNPTLKNTTTGEQISINVTGGSSDVIVIDTTLRSTTLNGGNVNALVATGSTYFQLRSGDNLLEFTNANVSGGYAVVQWYNSYLGV